MLSVFFVVSYLAMGVPAIAAGARLAATGNIVAAACEFGAVVIALAALSLADSLARRPEMPAKMLP